MAKNTGRIENLKTLSPEKAREYGKKGGEASVKARREYKAIAMMYAEILSEDFEITVRKKKGRKYEESTREVSPKELVKETVVGTLARCDASSVAMLKEIRENAPAPLLSDDDRLIIVVDEREKKAEDESQDE